ncbi:MAG: hypothetical protein E7576_02935 [Ruminococcaceae bacterium]|nr:hypothetical protein [Oscillospiraceae bacterium]
MKNKNERTEIAAVRRENLPGLSLVYALFRTKRSGRDGFAYSVSVSVTGEYGSETATASDLTDSREDAELIFRLLADQTVTPCALADVLEEIL